MRHRRFWPAMAFCMATLPTIGHAAVTEDSFLVRTTSDLVDLCSASPSEPMGTAALNFCHGFGVGVYRTLQEVDAARRDHMFCMPNPAPTRTEALTAFIQWAKASPDQLSRQPQDGIAQFLSVQYPCGRKK